MNRCGTVKVVLKNPIFKHLPFDPPPLYFIVIFLHNWGRLEKRTKKAKKNSKSLFLGKKCLF